MKKKWPDVSLSCEIAPETRDELKRASQKETRQWARLRLQVVDLVLDGHTIEAAAELTNTKIGSIRHWIMIFNQSGWQALLEFRYGRKYRRPKSSDDDPGERGVAETQRRSVVDAIRTAALRDDIASHLTKSLSPEDRRRLTAVDTILAGKSITEAAELYGCSPKTAGGWLRKFRHGGAGALITSSLLEPMLIADAGALGRLAAMDCFEPIKRALLALAQLATRHTLRDAAASVRAATETVSAWLIAYREDGVLGVWRYEHRSPRLFPASRLSGEQKQAIIEALGPEALPVTRHPRRGRSAKAASELGVTNAPL